MAKNTPEKPNSFKKYVLRGAFIPFVFRAVTLLAAFFSILYSTHLNSSFIDDDSLLMFIAAVAFLVFLPSLWWYPEKSKVSVLVMVGIEFGLCTALLFATGSIESPFVLYTFTPVLTAGLFLNRKYTYAIAGLAIVVIICSAVFNPLYFMHSLPLFLSQLSLYLVAVCLTATLPYLVNVNVRQLMEEENIMAERRRLSRDIHDGVAQTLHALCWQVQILRHRQAQANKDDSDLLKLETLAEKARRDILESLQILRSVDSARSFQNSLRESVQKLKQESDIEVFLNVETEDTLHLESHVELEMMRICQEALTNIRKHSGARTVQVDLKNANSSLELTIEDDGCGFDSLKYYRGEMPVKEHHGLSVMHERAQAINARLRVLSMPNRGTEIKLEVPLN